MTLTRHEQITRTLRKLAEAHATTMKCFEQTLALISEELAIDPFTYWRSSEPTVDRRNSASQPIIDRGRFSVTFRNQSCFLGNTRSFWFLAQLASRPNIYLSYEELFAEVWKGVRSENAVRSA